MTRNYANLLEEGCNIRLTTFQFIFLGDIKFIGRYLHIRTRIRRKGIPNNKVK